MIEKILLDIDNITQQYIDVTKLTELSQSNYLNDLTDIIFNNAILKNGIGVSLRDESNKRSINVKVGHVGYCEHLCHEYSKILFNKVDGILKEKDFDDKNLLQVYQEGRMGGRITFEINLNDDYDNRYLIQDGEEGFRNANKFMIKTKIIPLINTINDIANLVLKNLQELENLLREKN